MKSKDNRNIVKIYFAIFLVLLLNINIISSAEETKKWCWTRSMANEPTFTYDKKNGGLNWGYCKENNSNSNDNKYTAIVTTSSKENSETTSQIKIKLFGDLGKSEYLVLGSGFERGSDKKLFFDGPDLGGLQKIKLKLEGTQPYRCKKITIYKGSKSYNFECLKGMTPCTMDDPDSSQCRMEAEIDGSVPYEVTVKTSDDKNSGTNSPILMNILGKKGESQLKLLSENGFKDGNTKIKKMFINDIGEATGFKLTLSENGKWKPALIIIKNLLSKKSKKFELPNTLIINPGKNNFVLDTNTKKKIPLPPVSRALDIDNPDGGLLNYNDFKRIVNLKCDQKLFNPSPSKILFGPDYPTKKVNYMNVLARCPSNCHLRNDKVFGISIHPDNSPICMSALADNAISYYGGIVSISILPGLDNYAVPKGTGKRNGIEVLSYSSQAKKSYTITKVDNVDIVEKDIRILDNYGRISSEGRIEIRREGEWGSVCAIGNNKLSAKRICQDLGFRNGEWKSPSDQRSKNYCRTYNSRNHCGAINQIIHFSNLQCSELDTNFNSCNKDMSNPKTCTHDFDAIIRCFNENYENESIIPEGTIKLEASQKNGISVLGRLEMYYKEKYLPVCNLGFNKHAANIACKQMGFESGELITTNSITKAFQLDLESEINFSAEKIVCAGTESKLNECPMNTIDVKCKHDMDVVLNCSKGEGDVSGKSQYQKPVANPPPSLGKLGLVKIKLSCRDKGNNEKFRGDPGSIYLVECPSNCGTVDGTIWGTGIYTSNSHICKAAIHSGVIQNIKGGEFVISRSYGQNFYAGSKNNDIISTVYFGRWPASITFSSLNSGYKNLNSMAFSSFIEKKEEIKLVSKIRSKFQLFSFLETEENISVPTPVFEWLPKDFTFKFSDVSNVLLKKHKLTSIKTFSLIMKFKMTDFKNSPSFLFSFPGCNGLNVMLDEDDNLVIGDICNSIKRVKPEYMVPVQDNIVLFVSYNDGKVYVRIYSSQTKTIFEKTFNDKMLEFSNPGNIGIGRMGTENKGFFYGTIDFIQIYDSRIPKSLIDAIINTVKVPTKKGLIPAEKTVDNRACVAPCTTNPIPGNKGSGVPPPEANLYGGKRIDNLNDKKGKNTKAGDFGKYDKTQSSILDSIDIECDTNLNDKRFSGNIGMKFRINCKTCTYEKGVVFGTAIYHPLSSICKAAYHSGALKKGKAGTVILEIGPGQPAFNGSEGEDGSNSATFSGAKRSFMVKKSPKLTKISCTTKGNNIMFSQRPLYTRFVVLCPKNCLRFKGEIYGTGIYSENSSICKAAIHYGMIGNKGGEVQFIIDNGQQNYKGSRGFGINSRDKASHVRSFKFVGHRAAISFSFKEDYSGRIDKLWKTYIHRDADNPLSNVWKYVNKKNFKIGEKKKKLQAVYHEGTVSVSRENEFGSIISLKNSEWANSIIKFNFLLLDKNPFGTLIRFKDMQNYYAILFNVSGSKNIKLIKRVDGLTNVVLSKPLKILLKKWYRVTINLNYDNIKLRVQSHNIRQHKTIFKTQLTGISRGTLGFGSNGNKRFFLNGVEISEYKPNSKKKYSGNKRSWLKLLKSVSRRDRFLYCRNLYNSIVSEIHRCIEIHNYCQLRCDETIPRVENILNYSCSRDCVRTAHLAEGKNELSRLINIETWDPKKNEKCDYQPQGEKTYRMCIVKKVKRKKNKKLVTLKYMITPTKFKKAKVEYPSERLKRCGEKLTARNDCKFKNIKREN